MSSNDRDISWLRIGFDLGLYLFTASFKTSFPALVAREYSNMLAINDKFCNEERR
jgi:hypothetical protein